MRFCSVLKVAFVAMAAAGFAAFSLPAAIATAQPAESAARELLEETGYVASEWIALGRYAVDGNRGAGRAFLFLARRARWQQPIDADDLEEQALILMSRGELAAALHEGAFKVLPWTTAVALTLCRLSPD